MLFRLHAVGLSALVSSFALGAFVAPRAQADTYTIEHIGNGNYQHAVAIDDYGDYTIDLNRPSETCAGAQLGNGQSCYFTQFTDGTSYTGTSLIPLLTDPDPIAGAGCGAGAGPERLISCSNGHPIYYVLDYGVDGFNARGLYDGTSPTDYIDFSGSYDGFGVESLNGNFAYVDGRDEYVNLALDLTTAPTPEPSSFALLGSGLLAAAFGVKKRYVEARSAC